jgi:prepilin-type N-terminal cleavage/methylation domain-containing protein
MSARAVPAGARQNGRHVRRRCGCRPGFTLIEIVVVLLIVAVATAVTVPAFLQPRQDDALIDATGRIEALFRLARDSAARGGVPIVVAIDSATSAAWLYPEWEDAGDAAAATPSSRLPPRAPGALQRRAAQQAAGESLELPPSVRLELSKARARFVFRPAGATYGDSLVLRQGGSVRLITVDPWTGHARVY